MESAPTRYKVVLVVLVAIIAFALLPRVVRMCCQQAILYADQKQWEKNWKSKVYQVSAACYDYRQHPEQSLAQGKINKRQYQYIKRLGYSASCTEIMARK